METHDIGKKMHHWATELFPVCRSITGPGVRETLAYLKKLLPDLTIQSVPTGTQAFDWVVPNEWTIRAAYIENESGDRIVDFKNNNLHIVGYSTPIDKWMPLSELSEHLHSLPDQPNAIPYVTSYYKEKWGFCLAHEQYSRLTEGRYHVVIDSELKPGVLNYGELLIPGSTEEEVFLSTYICHPSMANNELSGPVVATALAQWVSALKNRRYTYRFVFIPETIGSIVYLSKNLETLRHRTIAGFVITCVGDDRTYSFLPSRKGGTLADRAAEHVLKHFTKKFERFTFLDRGSDERQYCSPLVDLPVCSVMRSKYAMYPEYHTSLDNLSLISSAGLQGSFEIYRMILEVLEANYRYKAIHPCQPCLGRRGLYNISGLDLSDSLVNILAYADGTIDLMELSEIIGETVIDSRHVAQKLVNEGLLCVVR